jgi:hypothetical protein
MAFHTRATFGTDESTLAARTGRDASVSHSSDTAGNPLPLPLREQDFTLCDQWSIFTTAH